MPTEEYVNRSQLSDFVARAADVTEEYPQMNEDNTKSKILRDFLELLGWDIAFDAELEYPVTVGTTKNFVDYALTTDGSSPVLFIEAKGYDTSVKDGHRDQIKSYLRQTDVDWGLLTNGGKFEIYRRESVADGVNVQTVAEFRLSDLQRRTDSVRLLTKKAIKSGRSGELAKERFEIRSARNTLEEEKEDIAETITKALTDVAGETVKQEARTESKELIDRVIDRLDHGNNNNERRSIGVGDDRNGIGKEPSFWQTVEESVGIEKIDSSIKFPKMEPVVEYYVRFIRFLFDQEYLTREDLPIKRPGGETRLILNTEREHENGTAMSNSREIVEGVYVETHQPTPRKKENVLKLGRNYGESR